VDMSFDRCRCALTVAVVGAVVVLAEGCSAATSDVGVESGKSATPGTPSASVRPLSATELVAALPTEGALPGYRVLDAPRPDADDGGKGGTSHSDVRPKACRPLWDATARAAESAASARVPIARSKFAPPTEFLSFASYDPGDAEAHLASLDKALSTCPSLSFLDSYGDRGTADVKRVENKAALGDASVSFRMHWTYDQGGFKSDTFVLVTVVRAGEATVTDVADVVVGNRLSAAKKRAFIPKVDPAMLNSQVDALREAQGH